MSIIESSSLQKYIDFDNKQVEENERSFPIITSISLQKYIDSANVQFEENENRLSAIESSFEARMNGKTMKGMIGSLIGTVCWFIVFAVFFWYIRGMVDNILFLICLFVSFALIGSLIVDEVISFSYFGKISSYKESITQLKNRVSLGKSSISSNSDTLMKAHSNGWHHQITVGQSIPEEAISIETAMNSVELLKGGVINRIKNILFYSAVIIITSVGSWSLFETADNIITGIIDESMEYDTLLGICIVGLLVACIGEVILAKFIWSKTDCTVTNITLFIIPVGPLGFIALVAIGAGIVMLVISVISVVIGLLVVAAIIGIVIAFIAGS